MLKKITLVCSMIVLGGCNHLTVNNFERSDLSAVSGNKVGLITLKELKDIPKKHSPLLKYMKKNDELADAIKSTCKAPAHKASPTLIPIASALGKLVFDRLIDKNTKEIEKLKKAAITSYSQRVILPSNVFNKHTCGIIYRYDAEKNDVGFVSVIKFKKHGNAFSITPTYVKAHNTVAITKKPDNEKEYANINASIAVSIKAIGKDKNGLPSLSSIGEGVVTIPNIKVSEESNNSCYVECGSSDLIPSLTNSNQFISVTFSVTETGKIGVDLDEKIAESKALKEAIGPAIKEAVKEYLDNN